MNIVCFTGWQQPIDALANVFPDAVHVDYAAHASLGDIKIPDVADVAIGWSLGGLVLVQAILQKKISAHYVILLATPFQFVASDAYPHAMSPAQFAEVQTGYAQKPARTVQFLNMLMGKGDSCGKTITAALNAAYAPWHHGAFWLEYLGTTSCAGIDFSLFPRTTIIHGAQDGVIPKEQAQLFVNTLPDVAVQIWPECGHAPHVHNPAALTTFL